MTQRLFLSFFCFLVLSLQACAEPALSEGHDVDEGQDIIIGSMDASNELILYLSPGQVDSLTLFLRYYSRIKELYIDKGRLRLVVREVPQMIFRLEDPDGGLTRYRTAQSYSSMLGVHLRCAYEYHGHEGYSRTWGLAGQAVAIASHEHDRGDWPYFDRDAMETVFVKMGRDAYISRDEYASCDQNPKKRSFSRVFDRNAEILMETLEISTPPVAYLNGKQVPMTRLNDHNELMLTLKETLDPEYALSGN